MMQSVGEGLDPVCAIAFCAKQRPRKGVSLVR